jgi:hypothetical protein
MALRETLNSTNNLNKRKSYNEILEMFYIFNLQTMLTSCRRCRSSVSWSNIVGCGWEVADRVNKTASVPEMRKKE